MIEIRFHPEAAAEYREALIWYEARSPQVATRFEAEAERALVAISASPGSSSKYDDKHRFVMLRRFPFTVIFRIQADLIQIVAFAHSRRSPGYWQGRS